MRGKSKEMYNVIDQSRFVFATAKGLGRVQGSWWNCGWMELGVDQFAVPIGVNQTPNGITALSIHMLYFIWIVSLWLYVPIFSLCTDMNLGPAQQVQQLICIWIMTLPKAVEVFLSIIRDCSLCMQMPNVASRRPCLWREIFCTIKWSLCLHICCVGIQLWVGSRVQIIIRIIQHRLKTLLNSLLQFSWFSVRNPDRVRQIQSLICISL